MATAFQRAFSQTMARIGNPQVSDKFAVNQQVMFDVLFHGPLMLMR